MVERTGVLAADRAEGPSAAKSASGKGRGEGAGAALYSFFLGGARLAAATSTGAVATAPAVVVPASCELRKSAASLVANALLDVSLL